MGNKQSDESSWLSWLIKKPAHVKKAEKKALKVKPQPSSDTSSDSPESSSSSSSDFYFRNGPYKVNRFKNAHC